MPEQQPRHAADTDTILTELDTDPDTGLSREEAANRLEQYGKNEIQRGEDISPWKIFISQFQDFLIYLLFFAALFSLAVGFLPGHEPEYVDATLIFLILLGNGIFGFIQDYKAEKSIEALKDMSSPDATVLRDGEKRTVDATNVVPGDIVFINQGDAVPADARILHASSLSTDESALTGESTQVSKTVDVLDEDTPLAERTNMVYMNTTAVTGRGKAVVTDTGMNTEVGDIAEQLSEAEERETPFQREVNELGKKIGYGIMAIIVFVAIIQLFATNAGMLSTFLVAISLAVAAVPEGLPAVVTLTLALGSRKMLAKDALVRRLPVVESLGSVNVIVTDKTGTLTEDTMTVQRVFTNDTVYKVTGTGTTTDGAFTQDGDTVNPEDLSAILRCGYICNNAEHAPEDEDTDYYGDPTEIALRVSAEKAEITPEPERVHEIPFSSKRKRMTVITEEESGEYMAYMKGAPETVLDRCTHIHINGETQELTEERRTAILEQNKDFASDALRVLGFAQKTVDNPDIDPDDVESDMVFLGLQGMIDPPRAEVKEAVQECRDAGIHVVMATGDNVVTAQAIGKEIGFDPDGALTGSDVEEMSDDELAAAVKEVEVFARVSPAHKVRILQTLQDQGYNVAMTGDGVNDAPALKNADVGVSMGVRGTDVAQQASDMVLQDDNFVTIRDAVAEGRGIFDNIRKFVSYLLSYNAGEVLLVFLGILIGSFFYPEVFTMGKEALVLTPVMLLWINLVTDGLPALALGADPKAPDVMERKPREPGEGVIDTRMITTILGIGVLMAVTILPFFFLAIADSLVTAQTLAFTMLVLFEIIGIQAIRKRYGSSLFSNMWLWAAIAATLVLQALVLYTPVNRFFNVVPLSVVYIEEVFAALALFLVLVAIFVNIEGKIFSED